ncbi:MAG: BMP family ABC transporter substrate-binding protein [Candidatus Limivivens sp.]|nr:BMP family ABC transporter substrate-binding protein [Candidatus Limivivens sp.]
MPRDDYSVARKIGQKQYHAAVSSGRYPYLQSLDEILSYTEVQGEMYLGLVDIPLDMIAGTKTAGRQNAFSCGFMPLLAEKSEFAMKWVALYDSHMAIGIHDPIVAYEFMNKFYVQEGNKRVSVMKSVGAVSIPGTVTRIIPKRTDDIQNKIYYEFMDFYEAAPINEILFTREGSYPALLASMGKTGKDHLSDDEIRELRYAYGQFADIFQAKGGKKLSITAGDAFLLYIKFFGYNDSLSHTLAEMKENTGKLWDEFELASTDSGATLIEEPEDVPRKSQNFLERLLPVGVSQKQKIAFIHEKNPETSSWTYGHELGRMHLEQTYPDQVETCHWDNVDPDVNGLESIEAAIDAGCGLIFTTTPRLIGASLKAAVNYPDVKILNCSVNTSYQSIRTYYGRMYEAKFLVGAIAAAMSTTDHIGYIGDYPICGSIANVNAFALGARMINPRAQIHLEWSKTLNWDKNSLRNNPDIEIISGPDMITPGTPSREFGLYGIKDGKTYNIATPVWHWGKYYEKIIHNILSGSWKRSKEALNYWWGMSANVIDVICSQTLPIGTTRLIDFLRSSICKDTFHPFYGILRSQDGIVQSDKDACLSPLEIVSMDWLAENVIGKIPEMEELTDAAKAVVLLQGINQQKAELIGGNS